MEKLDIECEVCTTGIEQAKEKLLELERIVKELKVLGLKNKTINLIIRDVLLKEQ